MNWQTERGYLRFGRNYHVKARMPRAKWQKKVKANEQGHLRDVQFQDIQVRMKSTRYFKKQEYIVLPDLYQQWYRQRKNNNWFKFKTQMIANYILDRLLLTKDLKAIKEVLVSIKGNFKE